jgi:DNA-binding NtrC family response regulator
MHQRNLLIVDDEENVLTAFERTLMDENYTIESAQSGEEALEKLTLFPAGIILSDYMMPGMNGLELLQKIKQRYPDTIRILITGRSDMQITIEAINKGDIFRFLLKPWDDDELKMALRTAFQYHDLLHENRKLLTTIKKQSSLLEEIESKYPGITKIKTEEDGTVVFEDEECEDIVHTFQLKGKE